MLVNKSENIFNLIPNIKILLLRQDRLGDLLISAPFIKELRKSIPNATIDILLSKKNIYAKQCIEDYVDNIYCYEKNLKAIGKLIINLRKENYDLIIDMLDNKSTTSTYLIKLITKRYSLGFDKENSKIYSHIVPIPDKSKIHIIERTCNLLLPFGIDANKLTLELEYKLKENNIQFANDNLGEKIKLRIGINLAGSSKSRYWGIENNINLINQIKTKYLNCEIILFATGEYIQITQEIIKASNFGILAPSTKDISDFAALLKSCDLIITPDTSVVHFASAFKIKCITLFNVMIGTPTPWIPYKTISSNLITEKEINTISPDLVFAEIQKLI